MDMSIIENTSVVLRCVHRFVRVGFIVTDKGKKYPANFWASIGLADMAGIPLSKPKYRHILECTLELEYDGSKIKSNKIRTKSKEQAFLLYKVLRSLKHAMLNLRNEDPIISAYAQMKVNIFHHKKIKIVHEYINHIPKSDFVRKENKDA
jgi:hypothetical protein